MVFATKYVDTGAFLKRKGATPLRRRHRNTAVTPRRAISNGCRDIFVAAQGDPRAIIVLNGQLANGVCP